MCLLDHPEPIVYNTANEYLTIEEASSSSELQTWSKPECLPDNSSVLTRSLAKAFYATMATMSLIVRENTRYKSYVISTDRCSIRPPKHRA